MFVAVATVIIFSVLHAQDAEWQSQLVYYRANDRLEYVRDADGNIIPDFSYAGYRNGEPIPDVQTVKEIDPIPGDNTNHINSALFELGLMALDSSGFRGALLLRAGVYEIRGTINVGYDGVVLRGVGDSTDITENTVLFATGNTPDKRTVVVLGGGGKTEWSDAVPGSRSDIISDTVLVGERTFRVSDPSLYSVGDNIIIYHPCTADWLQAIDYGGTHSDHPNAVPGTDVPWAVGSQPIFFNRYITAIDGDAITVDAPVFNALIRSLSQSYVYKYARNGIRTNLGIEDLRIEIHSADETDENHAWDAINFVQVEDAWALRCTMRQFGLSGIQTSTATRITVEDCQALDPASIIEGGKRYNFNVYRASQLILFKNCRASNGRHHYVSNGTSSVSGIVFVDCTSEGAYTSSEGHRRWTQGMLFDNHVELDGPRPGLNPRLLGLYNRGYYGTSHGWALVHSVAWNCDLADGDLIVQKPPTGQNYAIGCFGANVAGVSPPAPMDEPEGYIEGSNRPELKPRSLYYAQLEDRLGGIIGIRNTDDDWEPMPHKVTLYQNYPNPFNGQTYIRFDLYVASRIQIIIYDIRGQVVAQLADYQMDPGMQEIIWNGRTSRGLEAPTGVYLVSLKTENVFRTQKMVLLK